MLDLRGESLSHSVQPKARNPRDVCIRVEGSSTNTVNGHHIIGGEPFLKFIRNKNVSEIAILQAISKDLAAMAEKNLKTL